MGPNAVNLGGGFLDTGDNDAYLPAGPGLLDAPSDEGGVKPALAVQVDLARMHADPPDPGAYASMNVRSLPGIPHVGGFSGLFASGHAYLCPTIDSITGVFHGVL